MRWPRLKWRPKFWFWPLKEGKGTFGFGVSVTGRDPVEVGADVEAGDGVALRFEGQVTGYFTPIAQEYGGDVQAILVGMERVLVPEEFAAAVMMEGWGRLSDGRCLGRYGGRWHLADFPKDARGGELEVGLVAVDRSRVPLGSRLRVPSLPEPFGEMVFTAADVGKAIEGNDVDVYCGEGDEARRLSYAVTGMAMVEVLEG